jgi:hypothetical protein
MKTRRRTTKYRSPPKAAAKKLKPKPKPKERKAMSVFKKDKWIDPHAERERGGDADNAVREGADHPDPGAERSDPVDLNKLEEAIADPHKPQTVELQAALAVLVDAVMAGRTTSAPAARRGGKASRETREGEPPPVDQAALTWNEPMDPLVRRQLYLERTAVAPVENSLRAGVRLIGEELHKRGGAALMQETMLAIWNEDVARRAVMDLTWEGVGGEWYVSKNYEEAPAA